MGDALVSCSLLVLLSFAAVTASTPSASAAAPPTTAIFELQHRPLAVSAGRWGGAHPSNASAVEGERRGDGAGGQVSGGETPEPSGHNIALFKPRSSHRAPRVTRT